MKKKEVQKEEMKARKWKSPKDAKCKALKPNKGKSPKGI